MLVSVMVLLESITNESSWELSFLGSFVPGNFRSHYPIGLVAALLCVLNYCMFGFDFTLIMLTPL